MHNGYFFLRKRLARMFLSLFYEYIQHSKFVLIHCMLLDLNKGFNITVNLPIIKPNNKNTI